MNFPWTGRAPGSVGGCLLAGVLLCAAVAHAQSPAPVTRIAAAQASDDDNFGAAIALDEQFAVVGAPLHDGFSANAGAAWLFERDAVSGEWTESATIGGGDLPEFAFFARSVGLSGDVLVAGTPESPTNTDDPDPWVDNAGSAYVFERDAGGTGTWPQTAKFIATDGIFGDEFGRSVAVEGANVAVGAQFHDTVGVSAGAVYIFSRDSTSGLWQETDKLLPSDSIDLGFFGAALAMDSNLLLVGAPGEFFSQSNSGAAYLFEQSAPPFSNWMQIAKLTGTGVPFGSRFGGAVALHGDVIAVSSIHNDGTVYVFEKNAAGDAWPQTATLSPNPPSLTSGFGSSVAVDGNLIIVGAPFDGEDGAGGAYVFSRGGPGNVNWNQIAHIQIDDTAGARVGFSVAARGGNLLLGAPLANVDGSYSGVAYATTSPTDIDGDGIADHEDNCSDTVNGPALPDNGGNAQRDTAGDGFGNVCDADFNGDCTVDFADLALMRMAFFTIGDVDEDLNGDGFVNFTDLAIMKVRFFSPPGPSGTATDCDQGFPAERL